MSLSTLFRCVDGAIGHLLDPSCCQEVQRLFGRVKGHLPPRGPRHGAHPHLVSIVGEFVNLSPHVLVAALSSVILTLGLGFKVLELFLPLQLKKCPRHGPMRERAVRVQVDHGFEAGVCLNVRG